MSRSLFLFTIGPVQSFIAQARKTQDLYAGSKLLSHLCKTGIDEVQTKFKGETIFPNPKNKSLPNRFLAILPHNDIKKLQKIGEQIELRVKSEIDTIGSQIILNLIKSYVDIKRIPRGYLEN